MFVGFSKNLGNGFRVGIGGNLNSSTRSNKPTQRELQKLERQEFLDRINENFNDALADCLLAQGIFPDFELDPNIKSYTEIDETIRIKEEFSKLFRVTNDGGRFTGKRKEELLLLLYEIQDIFSKLNPKHPLYDKYYENQKKIKSPKGYTFTIWLCVITGIPLLFIPFLFMIPMIILRSKLRKKNSNLAQETLSTAINGNVLIEAQSK